MKDIETIKQELQIVKYYYAAYDTFYNRVGSRFSPPDSVIKIANEYSQRIFEAPIRLRMAFDHLYRLNKSQKKYAEECGVTDKYIQILNKRIINFFYDTFNKEQK